MKTICLYFQIHQPFRLKRYRFFDIGNDHYYYDDFTNETILQQVAKESYLKTNELLLQQIKNMGNKFKVAFSISGCALDQFELYAPEIIDSFKELAQTGQVEFLAETYAHSLVALKSSTEFKRQVNAHSSKIEALFGVKPTVFRNTELIYSDDISKMVSEMGFDAMLTEGAKHILGWKSPNFLYCSSASPRLKVLLRNFKLSDDIAFRFSNQGWNEYPLTAEKYVDWILKSDTNDEVVNIFMDYETFGEHQKSESGIFEFLKAFPAQAIQKGLSFSTPSELAEKLNPVSAIHVPFAISWADEERDLTAWLGNELQDEAFQKLYSLRHRVHKTEDPKILKNWMYLQTSDHFYYMCTKFFSDGDVHAYFNPYESPYDAFMNYMNVLSDFEIEVKNAVSEPDERDQKIADLEAKLSETKLKLKRVKETSLQINSSVKKTSRKELKKSTSLKSVVKKK